MNGVTWVHYMNEGVSLLFLIGMGFALYRGLKRNQAFLAEREELLRRYLLFRGDLQVRLKIYGEDEKTYQELLRNLSESWKNFKKTYDQHLHALAKNTKETRRFLLFLTLGLFINTARLLIEKYFFFSLRHPFFYALERELSNYVLVILGFWLLKSQTSRLLSQRGEPVTIEREILFYSNSLSKTGEREDLYNEFSPLEETGAGNGKED
jgi:hypothetical protein